MRCTPFLLHLWKEVFQREDIDIYDTFLALGGTEALATRLVAQLSAATGATFTVRMLFESPTIAEFAVLMDHLGELLPYRPMPLLPRGQRTEAGMPSSAPVIWADQNRKYLASKPQWLRDSLPAVPFQSQPIR